LTEKFQIFLASFTDADLAAYHVALLPALEAYKQLDRMPDELPPVN